MKTLVIPLFLLILIISSGASGQAQAPPAHAAEHSTPKAAPKYGSNTAVGKTFTHDGVKLYYEVYGAGQPLLLVHGNGGSIADFTAQINYFRKRYKVIAMDSRDQGRSSDSTDKITYEKMTDDLGALIDHLKTGPVYVLGWSDGGIEALLLGIRHPDKVKKLAAMAANLDPLGIYPEVVDWVKSTIDSTYRTVVLADSEGRTAMKMLRHFAKHDGLVFHSKNNGTLAETTILTQGLHPVVKALGLPKAGMHAFRRGCNRRWELARVSSAVVRQQMGHATADMTALYTGEIPVEQVTKHFQLEPNGAAVTASSGS